LRIQVEQGVVLGEKGNAQNHLRTAAVQGLRAITLSRGNLVRHEQVNGHVDVGAARVFHHADQRARGRIAHHIKHRRGQADGLSARVKNRRVAGHGHLFPTTQAARGHLNLVVIELGRSNLASSLEASKRVFRELGEGVLRGGP